MGECLLWKWSNLPYRCTRSNNIIHILSIRTRWGFLCKNEANVTLTFHQFIFHTTLSEEVFCMPVRPLLSYFVCMCSRTWLCVSYNMTLVFDHKVNFFLLHICIYMYWNNVTITHWPWSLNRSNNSKYKNCFVFMSDHSLIWCLEPRAKWRGVMCSSSVNRQYL